VHPRYIFYQNFLINLFFTVSRGANAINFCYHFLIWMKPNELSDAPSSLIKGWFTMNEDVYSHLCMTAFMPEFKCTPPIIRQANLSKILFAIVMFMRSTADKIVLKLSSQQASWHKCNKLTALHRTSFDFRMSCWWNDKNIKSHLRILQPLRIWLVATAMLDWMFKTSFTAYSSGKQFTTSEKSNISFLLANLFFDPTSGF